MTHRRIVYESGEARSGWCIVWRYSCTLHQLMHAVLQCLQCLWLLVEQSKHFRDGWEVSREEVLHRAHIIDWGLGKLKTHECGITMMSLVSVGTLVAFTGRQSSVISGQYTRSDKTPLRVAYFSDSQGHPSRGCIQSKCRTWSEGQLRAKDVNSSSSIENQWVRSTTSARRLQNEASGRNVSCET